MKKNSSKQTQSSKRPQGGRLTIGIDLGDKTSRYCVLDEKGEVVREDSVSTTAAPTTSASRQPSATSTSATTDSVANASFCSSFEALSAAVCP